MLVDCIVAVLCIIALFKGFSKGLIVGLFSFIAFVVGLAAALKLSAIAAAYIGRAVNISGRLLPVLAFLVVFILVALLVRLGAGLLQKLVQLSMLGWLNRLGGVVFYLLLYLFIFSIVLFYVQQLHIIKADTIQTSVTYPYIQPLGPKIINSAGTIIPAFKNLFTQLLQFFQKVGDKSDMRP